MTRKIYARVLVYILCSVTEGLIIVYCCQRCIPQLFLSTLMGFQVFISELWSIFLASTRHCTPIPRKNKWEKKSEENGYRGTEGKPCTPTRASDALIGDKEQTKRNGEWLSNPSTLDHLVTSYNPQGSYVDPIFLPHRSLQTLWRKSLSTPSGEYWT